MKIYNHGNDKVLLEFNNGIRLSTVWGYCMYSDNYNKKTIDTNGNEIENGFGKHEEGSTNVEFMFTNMPKEFEKIINKKFGGIEEPEGYVPLEKWLDMVIYLRKLDKKEN